MDDFDRYFGETLRNIIIDAALEESLARIERCVDDLNAASRLTRWCYARRLRKCVNRELARMEDLRKDLDGIR